MQSNQTIKSFVETTKKEGLQENEMMTLCDVIDFIRNKRIDVVAKNVPKIFINSEERSCFISLLKWRI